MRKTTSGFTIVELLIVIVVVGILAAISLVAYSNVQSRTRDAKRLTDVKSIQKGLELYKTEYGTYPAHIAATTTDLPSGFAGVYGCPTCYSYSVATNGTWLRNLTDSGKLSQVPISTPNDNSNFYMYWRSGPNGYNTCTQEFYILVVNGFEGTPPANSSSVYCTTAHFTTGTGRLVFSNIVAPSP